MAKFRPGCRWNMEDEKFVKTGNPLKMMVFVSHLHKKKMEKLLTGTGLHRAQHRLLMTLSEYNFKSQAELAEGLGVSTATVAVSLKKLERDGYIKKQVMKDDSRVNFIILTSKGESVVEESRRFFEYMDDESTKGFTEEELAHMRAYLKRIYDNLNNL